MKAVTFIPGKARSAELTSTPEPALEADGIVSEPLDSLRRYRRDH
ncbi:MAG: hypothetical protein ACREJP_08880 [Candidatus Methylomirabilales bacterium]